MSSINALILEDDPNNMEILVRLLKSINVGSVGVNDPSQIDGALQQVSAFDLVFLDLEMPTMDGYEMLGALRARLGAGVPIIACTVHLNEINNARSRGFSSFIGKPLKQARFPDQVRRILAGEPVWEAK
mgnify:CR=1 FL=1